MGGSLFKKGFLHRLSSSTRGFTLMEVAIATALLSLGISLVGTAVFQVLGAQGNWQDEVVATKDLRHVGSWFSLRF